MQCQQCGIEFDGESWKKICRKCFAESKNKNQTSKSNTNGIESREKAIIKQTLYKVAGRLLDKNTPAQKVNEYVAELEKGFYQ